MNGERDGALAVDLLEHPGWLAVLRDVTTEAKAARRIIFNRTSDAPGEEALVVEHARGSIDVLRNVVRNVYIRANKELPAHIAALFE